MTLALQAMTGVLRPSFPASVARISRQEVVATHDRHVQVGKNQRERSRTPSRKRLVAAFHIHGHVAEGGDLAAHHHPIDRMVVHHENECRRICGCFGRAWTIRHLRGGSATAGGSRRSGFGNGHVLDAIPRARDVLESVNGRCIGSNAPLPALILDQASHRIWLPNSLNIAWRPLSTGRIDLRTRRIHPVAPRQRVCTRLPHGDARPASRPVRPKNACSRTSGLLVGGRTRIVVPRGNVALPA